MKLDIASPVAIVGSQQRLTQAREVVHAIISQLVYHHSPEDVRLIVLAPQSQEKSWRWATFLPHTRAVDPGQSNENTDEASDMHAVAILVARTGSTMKKPHREAVSRGTDTLVQAHYAAFAVLVQ
jgi:DNA segregation ATPase FtsK/SpoIIIE-like protein